MFQILKILGKKQKITLLVILIMMFIMGFFEFLSISAILPILATFTNQSTEIEFFNNYLTKIKNLSGSSNFIIICSLFLLASFLLKNIFFYIYTKFVTSFMFYLSVEQQMKTFSKYISLPYEVVRDVSSSKILRDINVESRLIISQFTSPILTLLLNTITITFILIFLSFYNFKLTMILVIGFSFFAYLFIFLFKKRLEEFGTLRLKFSTRLLQSIKETFDGLRELKIYKKDHIFLKNFRKTSIKITNMGIKQAMISALPKILTEVFLIIVFVSVVVFTINKYPIEQIMGSIAMYAVSGLRLMPIFLSANSAYQKINFSKATVDVILKHLNQEGIDEKTKKYNNFSFKEKISFENVSFNYEKENVIFQNFSTTINKNSFIGISGASGSGKSTFVDLLAGLVKPQKGKILIDNIETNKLYNDNINNLFSYVQQKVHLFNTSILKNITFEEDIKKIDIKKLEYTLKFCELEKMIENLPNGIDSSLSAFGTNISGGQLQRVGLARAIYKDSEIVLLDEALSNLDDKNKDLILDRIAELKANKTIIYISHDVSELKKCDSIIELKKI
jgi:ATP-binding cassette, subfamily B, bacterial PglK